MNVQGNYNLDDFHKKSSIELLIFLNSFDGTTLDDLNEECTFFPWITANFSTKESKWFCFRFLLFWSRKNDIQWQSIEEYVELNCAFFDFKTLNPTYATTNSFGIYELVQIQRREKRKNLVKIGVGQEFAVSSHFLHLH